MSEYKWFKLEDIHKGMKIEGAAHQKATVTAIEDNGCTAVVTYDDGTEERWVAAELPKYFALSEGP